MKLPRQLRSAPHVAIMQSRVAHPLAGRIKSEEGNRRRLLAGIRGWERFTRDNAGEKLMPTKHQIKKKAARKRIRLHETVAKEAREIQEIARRHAHAAMKRMAEIAETSQNEAAAIAAAGLLLDRAYGKANQTHINANIDANGKAADISQGELDTRIETALKRVDALTGGKAKAPPSQKQLVDLREHDRDPDSSTKH